jgi:hypothetical protein
MFVRSVLQIANRQRNLDGFKPSGFAGANRMPEFRVMPAENHFFEMIRFIIREKFSS